MPGTKPSVSETKICGVCKQEVARELYSRDKKSRDGLYYCCKPCDRVRSQNRYRETLDPDKLRKRSAAWREANPHRSKGYKLKHSFGFGIKRYLQMLEEQNSACAICGVLREPPDWLQVDHDHDSGAIRGLLCGHCNRGLGFFRDNTELLTKAILYLQDNLSTRSDPTIINESKV